MRYTTGKHFLKNARKLSVKQKQKLQETLRLWEADPSHPRIHDHALLGKYKGYRSLNIGGDLRLIYRQVTATQVLLYDIGTHSQLYR